MKMRIVEYTTKKPRIAAMDSGENHHRSVRSVLSLMDARGCAPVGKVGRGLADVVVMWSLPNGLMSMVHRCPVHTLRPITRGTCLGSLACDTAITEARRSHPALLVQKVTPARRPRPPPVDQGRARASLLDPLGGRVSRRR